MSRPRHYVTIGPLGPNSAAIPHYLPPREQFAIPTRITNASSTETYSQAHAWRGSAQRPGCNDFLQHKSRGLG